MRKTYLVLLAFLLSLTLPLSSAQEFNPPSWELGWDTDMDSTYLVDLEDDWDLTGELVFYINNEQTGELNIDMTYDYDEDGPFDFDGPDSVSVGGSSNKSFSISISGADAETVRAFSPSSSIKLTVLAQETVGETPVRDNEIEGDISTPRMYQLLPEVQLPTDTLFSGSWVDFTLEVSNLGNNQDAITSGEATIRSCPHLSVTGLDSLEGTVVAVTDENGTGVVSFTLRLEATSSHQERTCEVSISILSEGDGTTRSSTMNVNVEAPQSTDNSGDSSDDTANDDKTSTGSESMPALSLIEIFFVLLLTSWFSLRSQREFL
ncbi:hypothetical protein N9M83_01140 [Candidatus Poseidonia alphae]|nr:hypothetical protein [Candidatus Poseidonia alphae]MDA8531042.1 hypothetical protein [Candidatus Poseidonia alphae]MDA8638713.1 hypothetical protein [Candidatus Poseidonia alphae]MDA8749633.1 hypothetical protein [Candidatus Poseidonia alphae]MDA8758823.1 hypothetical protein [Candidatus Poseidonia alphae]